MCVVSMIMEYGRDRIPPSQWTPEGMEAFRRALEAAREADKVLKQPHCHDPQKAEWMKSIEARLAKLEQKPKPKKRRRK